MKKKVGDAHSLHPYLLTEHYALVRMYGSEAILDLIIYLDEEKKIKGIFE